MGLWVCFPGFLELLNDRLALLVCWVYVGLLFSLIVLISLVYVLRSVSCVGCGLL